MFLGDGAKGHLSGKKGTKLGFTLKNMPKDMTIQEIGVQIEDPIWTVFSF
jgi:hypothetical protein